MWINYKSWTFLMKQDHELPMNIPCRDTNWKPSKKSLKHTVIILHENVVKIPWILRKMSTGFEECEILLGVTLSHRWSVCQRGCRSQFPSFRAILRIYYQICPIFYGSGDNRILTNLSQARSCQSRENVKSFFYEIGTPWKSSDIYILRFQR